VLRKTARARKNQVRTQETWLSSNQVQVILWCLWPGLIAFISAILPQVISPVIKSSSY
jgi:hypothetical protein